MEQTNFALSASRPRSISPETSLYQPRDLALSAPRPRFTIPSFTACQAGYTQPSDHGKPSEGAPHARLSAPRSMRCYDEVLRAFPGVSAGCAFQLLVPQAADAGRRVKCLPLSHEPLRHSPRTPARSPHTAGNVTRHHRTAREPA